MDDLPREREGGADELEPAAVGRRLLALVAPIAAAGLVAAIAAAWTFAAAAPSLSVLGGLGLMLAFAVLAEAYPVQIESLPAGNVSLAAVFVVSSGLLYGWQAAVLVALVTRLALEVAQRRPTIKLVANGSVYCLSGLAAGLAETLVPDRSGTLELFGAVLLGATAFYVANVVLISAIVSRVAGEPPLRVLARMAYWTIVPFAIMASVSLILYVLWQRSPLTVTALAGPLVAIILYQRSVQRSLAATRLALTDELTGLGNQRNFHERFERDLDRALTDGSSLTLCLIDLDDFKRVNDTYGHPAGDEILRTVASNLRQGGEAFRIGGDEFAILLPSRSESDGVAVAEAVADRMRSVRCPDGAAVTVSAGVATFPSHGVARTELQRLADRALYRAKRDGKGVVRAYRAGLVALESNREDSSSLAARLALRLGLAEHAVASALAAENAAARLRAVP